MSKTLVTGVTGFMGRNLLPSLKGEKVGTARSNSDIDADLSKPGFTRKFPPDVDRVIHLAALFEGDEGDREMFQVNVNATLELLEYAKAINVQNFVYASTASVYATKNSALKEADRLGADNMYELTKLLGEELTCFYREFFTTVILRYVHPYGPGQQKHRLIPGLIEKIKNEKEVTLHVGGKPMMNPIYIEDAVDATLMASRLRVPASINVAGPQCISIKELSEVIGRATAKKPRYKYDRLNVGNRICDISTAKKVLRFQPSVDIEEGIARCIE